MTASCASLSLHSVGEDAALNLGASMTLCSVTEDLGRSRGTSGYLSGQESILPVASRRASVDLPRLGSEEYEEDFEDYSGSERSLRSTGDVSPEALSPLARCSSLTQQASSPAARFDHGLCISAERSEAAGDFEAWESSSNEHWSNWDASEDEDASLDPSPNLRRALELDLDEIDTEQSVSATWSIGPGGAMRHITSDTRISPNVGVTFQGREYRLSPEDIEFERGPQLGAGSCGVVSKGRIKSSGTPVAVKVISVNDRTKREQLLNEIRGLVQSEGCPYLVQWHAGFVSKATGKVHVAMEFMDRGSLADLNLRLRGQGVSLDHLPCMSAQMMSGLAHLHARRILHRDVKPENVLHNRQGEVKLTDFGIAKDLDGTLALAKTFIGTTTYMSPERCLGKDYSLASDVWSAGMVLFQLATGQYPFSDVSSFPALLESLCDRPEPRLDASRFPAALCDLVARCLTRDTSQRPKSSALRGHSFVAGCESHRAGLAKWLRGVYGDGGAT